MLTSRQTLVLALPEDVSTNADLHARCPEDVVEKFRAADGAYVPVLRLIVTFVKVVIESPHIRQYVRWVLASDGSEKLLHWIIMIGPDGWPFLKTREDGATSASIECANLMMKGQLKALSLELFAIMAAENSEMSIENS